LIGHSVLDVFHPGDHAQVLEQLAACRTNVSQTITWELRKVRKDRTTLWVREYARAVPDPKGQLVILIVCEDITDRKIAERALRRAHVRVQAIQAERERLAHDLHDNIIQRLYAIGMGLEDGRYRLKEEGEGSISPLLNRSIEELNLVIEDVRNFIGGKDPLLQLSPASTAARFRKLARKRSNGYGTAIDARIDDGVAEDLSDIQRKHLYLIAQEAVNNILRHSQAAKGSLYLRAEPHGIVMTIQDNGIGFDPTAPMMSRFGLKTMRARAKKIGARFKLRSHRQKGTTVTVELPQTTDGE
jgi:signal transduction histidine kinase